jgi:uncharacterized integral membrane protein
LVQSNQRSIPDQVMDKTAAGKGWALILVPLAIAILSSIFAVIAYFMSKALGLPERLHLPWELRAIGVGVIALGCLFMAWVFKVRRPLDLINSTSVTVLKTLKGTPPQVGSGPDRTFDSSGALSTCQASAVLRGGGALAGLVAALRPHHPVVHGPAVSIVVLWGGDPLRRAGTAGPLREGV